MRETNLIKLGVYDLAITFAVRLREVLDERLIARLTYLAFSPVVRLTFLRAIVRAFLVVSVMPLEIACFTPPRPRAENRFCNSFAPLIFMSTKTRMQK